MLTLIQSYSVCSFLSPSLLFIFLPAYLLSLSPSLPPSARLSLSPSCGHSVAALYNVSKSQKKKLGEVQQPGVVGLSPELCYLFFSILKAWQACFQHFHTCPAKGRREADKKEELVMGVRGRCGESECGCVVWCFYTFYTSRPNVLKKWEQGVKSFFSHFQHLQRTRLGLEIGVKFQEGVIPGSHMCCKLVTPATILKCYRRVSPGPGLSTETQPKFCKFKFGK